jgi:hypothetical protein
LIFRFRCSSSDSRHLAEELAPPRAVSVRRDGCYLRDVPAGIMLAELAGLQVYHPGRGVQDPLILISLSDGCGMAPIRTGEALDGGCLGRGLTFRCVLDQCHGITAVDPNEIEDVNCFIFNPAMAGPFVPLGPLGDVAQAIGVFVAEGKRELILAPGPHGIEFCDLRALPGPLH